MFCLQDNLFLSFNYALTCASDALVGLSSIGKRLGSRRRCQSILCISIKHGKVGDAWRDLQ